MNGLSERALPAFLLPTKPKAIVAGIEEQQVQYLNTNTIPTPTTAGQEIQWFLPRLEQTFLDPQSSYFVFHCSLRFQIRVVNSFGNTAVYNNECQGAFLGSFYNMFQRYTVFAGSTNSTDDIVDVGVVATHYLRISMSTQAKNAMAMLLGFNCNPTNVSGLLGYRIMGPHPQICYEDPRRLFTSDNDCAQRGFTGPATTGGASPFTTTYTIATTGWPRYFSGDRFLDNDFITQEFDFALPLLGSLGVNNDNPYYMGLGNTRITLVTADPADFIRSPPRGYEFSGINVEPVYVTAANAYPGLVGTTNVLANSVANFVQVPAGAMAAGPPQVPAAAVNLQGPASALAWGATFTTQSGAVPSVANNNTNTLPPGAWRRGQVSVCSFTIVNWTIQRAKFVGNIIRLDESVWRNLLGMIRNVNGDKIVSKVTTFVSSTVTLPQGSAGMLNPQFNVRRGSVKHVLTAFNPVGAAAASASYFTDLAQTKTNGTTIWNRELAAGTITSWNIEIANWFGKVGSINPGCGANTFLSVNNQNYPKLGLNPTEYPMETFSYIMDCLNQLNSSNMKPTIHFQNWLAADPSIVTDTRLWRSGVIIGALQQIPDNTSTNTPDTDRLASASIWWLWTMISPDRFNVTWNNLGMETTVFSNDFFLFFDLEDAPRPGMLSGKSTMDGSNYMNLNLIAPTSYNYTLYFICAIDALLVHEIDTLNVYYVQ